MSRADAERRLRSFTRSHGGALTQLACHASLPVVLNPDLIHLLRINYFLDPPLALPYAAEAQLLLSPLCTEVDDGLYVIDPDLRDVLLQRLLQDHGGGRLRDVARLLWEYGQRATPWLDRPGLSEAQQLTAMNFVDPRRAQAWLEKAEAGATGSSGAADARWFVAMRRDLTERASAVKQAQAQAGSLPSALPALTELRDVLAELVSSVEQIVKIAGDAGIEAAETMAGVSAVTLWHQILDATWSSNRMGALFGALWNLGKHPTLVKAVQEYWIKLSPALRVEDGRFETPPPEWQVLEQNRDQIEQTLRALCLLAPRDVERRSHGGAMGFLAGERAILTHESMADQFREQSPQTPEGVGGLGADWTPNRGVAVWLAFADRHSGWPKVFRDKERREVEAAIAGLVRARVMRVDVVGKAGLAVLTLAVDPDDEEAMPPPLLAAAAPPPQAEGRKVYVMGYPALSDRRVDPAVTARIMGESTDVLRVQPGEIVSIAENAVIGKDDARALTITHNCFTLGGNGGSPLVDLASGQVLGLHFAAMYEPGPRGLKAGQAIALWALRLEPVLVRAGVFGDAPAHAATGERREQERVPASVPRKRDRGAKAGATRLPGEKGEGSNRPDVAAPDAKHDRPSTRSDSYLAAAGLVADVYLSYSHIDDAEIGQRGPGWVSRLRQDLEVRLSQLLGFRASIWQDRKDLRAGDSFGNEIERVIRGSSVFLAVISPSYVRSDFARRELDLFLNEAGHRPDLTLSRAMWVSRIPVPLVDLPPVLQEIQGILFYEMAADGPREFSPHEGPNAQLLYRRKVQELARWIASVLKTLRDPEGNAP